MHGLACSHPEVTRRALRCSRSQTARAAEISAIPLARCLLCPSRCLYSTRRPPTSPGTKVPRFGARRARRPTAGDRWRQPFGIIRFTRCDATRTEAQRRAGRSSAGGARELGGSPGRYEYVPFERRERPGYVRAHLGREQEPEEGPEPAVHLDARGDLGASARLRLDQLAAHDLAEGQRAFAGPPRVRFDRDR